MSFEKSLGKLFLESVIKYVWENTPKNKKKSKKESLQFSEW